MRTLGLFALVAATWSVAIVAGPRAIAVLLQLPPGLCPSEMLRCAMTGTYFLFLAVGVAASCVVVSEHRRPGWRTIGFAAAGAITASATFIAIMYVPAVTAALVSGRGQHPQLYDIMRWGQAFVTAAGASLGFVVSRRRPTRR